MLGTDFCAWVQTWLGIYVGAIASPSLAGETCPFQIVFAMWYVLFSLVTQSCQTLCNPVDCSTPKLTWPLLELGQTHVHRVGDSIQPFHPLSSSLLLPSVLPSNRVFSNESFLTSVGQSIGGSISASLLPMNIQDWLPLGWLSGSPCSPRDSQESCPKPQFKTINSSLLTILYGATVTSIHDNWKNHSFDYTEIFQQSNVSTFKKFV